MHDTGLPLDITPLVSYIAGCATRLEQLSPSSYYSYYYVVGQDVRYDYCILTVYRPRFS